MRNTLSTTTANIGRVVLAFSTLLPHSAVSSAETKPDDKQTVDFATQIRPLLSDSCFHCHGPSEEDREADLRLDSKQFAFVKLSDGHSIVAGAPEQSVVYQRITSDDEDQVMPPAESGKKLTAEQKELIRLWIQQGASWSEHWSFIPPVRPELPKVRDESWINNPIDAFILKRLEDAGLQPNPRAEDLKRLRRLHLDLTGLPPTIREIDSYLKDGPQAYERRVDQLLRSPHYGEKWARHWLDAARYSDSDGFEKDKPRFVWNYRDWVVRALNRDLPYDQFIIEQLAGDLLPNATQDQRIATGYLRNSMLNEEGGIDPEQFRMEAMFDRMDAIGKSILGLTIQCSQCHTHKYDPISQEDYYRLFAFINNSYEHSAVVYSAEQQLQRQAIAAQIRQIEDELKATNPSWSDMMRQWEASLRNDQPNWQPLPIENSSGSNSERYYPQADHSILAQGYAPSRHTGKFAVDVAHEKMQSIRLELLPDPDLPAGGPGRGLNGLFALSEIKLQASSIEDPEKQKWVKFVRASADYSNPSRLLDADYYSAKNGAVGVIGTVEYAIDDDATTAWGTDEGPVRRNVPRKAVFVADEDFAFAGGTRLEFHLVQQHGGWNSDDNQSLNLGRFRLSVLDHSDVTADPIPKPVRDLFNLPHDQRTDDDIQTIFSFWRTTVQEWAPQNEQIEALWQLHPEGTMQLVLLEREDDPRKTHLLDRGDFLSPLQELTPGVPDVLNEFTPELPANRLGFAQWITRSQSPTVARAAVNRAWQAFFGTGIVATSEDLGSQGEAPSHPQLLDWLAVEFMEDGWSMKELHRKIVMSATYQQDSAANPEKLERDPYNRLLARGPRFRVDGELVRDIALRASGLINLEIGGPGVYPPSAKFLYLPPTSYGPKRWPSDAAGRSKYRRALYTFRYRSVPHPALKNFDTPNGDAACVRRDRSNTPLQALTTLNEPLFMECAQALALKTVQQGGSDDAERIRFAFRSCLTREPTDAEKQRLTELLASQRKRLKSGELDAQLLVTDEAGRLAVQTAPGVTVDAKQLAEWTVVCRVMLNLDETITKD